MPEYVWLLIFLAATHMIAYNIGHGVCSRQTVKQIKKMRGGPNV